jgi:hypothetical protein
MNSRVYRIVHAIHTVTRMVASHSEIAPERPDAQWLVQSFLAAPPRLVLIQVCTAGFFSTKIRLLDADTACTIYRIVKLVVR